MNTKPDPKKVDIPGQIDIGSIDILKKKIKEILA